MLTDETIKEVLEYVESKGIVFTDHYLRHFLTADQALLFIKDEDLAYADVYEVSLEHYRAWQNMDGCSAMTKKKRKCLYPNVYRPQDPANFKPGVSDRCPFHGGPRVTES